MTTSSSRGAHLERDAADELAEALEDHALHLDGARARHRAHLVRAIELAYEALAIAPTLTGARLTLVRAHAARAEDARHGAGQLSRGSQRAPTEADCEDGWERVEAIVATAEASALEARRIATELGDPVADRAARAAEIAAREARRIVEERNHAYTFHADPGFSFGEGYYLAAAAVLAGVAIQLRPGAPQAAQAARFLRDAGLADRVVPYRSRPRANKALPALVADAFRADAEGARARLRAAFLGDAPIPDAIAGWADDGLSRAPRGDKILLWVRHAAHHPTRNSTHAELVELSRRALEHGLTPILIGDALRDGEVPAGAVDLTLFWRLELFQGDDMRRAQLQLFEHLRRAHRLVGQVGVTTAAMDGPALLGLPTMYLTQAPNVRLGRWVGVVPGYEEVVRREGYLEHVSGTFARWSSEEGR
ncbi:MAG: hypothetical protein H6719_29965 [Sandaracinaceae bacterium]|nr:hypothetical protein [Sandaracinaceae bacterium]